MESGISDYQIATCYEIECKIYISRAQVMSYNTSIRRITLVTSALQDTLEDTLDNF